MLKYDDFEFDYELVDFVNNHENPITIHGICPNTFGGLTLFYSEEQTQPLVEAVEDFQEEDMVDAIRNNRTFS